MRVERIGLATLYLGDALGVLASLDEGAAQRQFDLFLDADEPEAVAA